MSVAHQSFYVDFMLPATIRNECKSVRYLSDFNEIELFSTDFRRSPQLYQILRKPMRCKTRRYMRMDGKTDEPT
jgi:hypothetical protein